MDQGIVTPLAPPPAPATKRSSLPPKRTAPPPARPKLSVHPLTPWAVTSAAVIILALAILGVIPTSLRSSRPWQSVFLTNGQVYFGHVVRQTLTTIVLRDVYYLQVSPSLQQRQPDQPPPPPGVTLVKLGTELHGPTDEMRINREHVLFVEQLRGDATVVRAIDAARERAAQPKVPATPETTPEPTPPESPPA